MQAKDSMEKIALGSPKTSNKTLWLSILLALVGALANILYLNKVQGSSVEALKSKSRIVAGTKVDDTMFEKTTIYGEDLKQMKALVVEHKDLNAFSQAPLAETLEPGQILLQGSFTFPGTRGLRDMIGPDQRAIALDIKDESSAVAYFVKPGDTVDVWSNDENIIPRATVRAVGDATVPPGSAHADSRYRTVTVVVPEASIKEIFGKLELGKGNIKLALAGSSNTAKR